MWLNASAEDREVKDTQFVSTINLVIIHLVTGLL